MEKNKKSFSDKLKEAAESGTAVIARRVAANEADFRDRADVGH